MKAMILGGRGQLACAIKQHFEGAACLPREDCDIRKQEDVEAAFERHSPNVVFNCAGYNEVDDAEDDPLGAVATNALAVRHLSLACRKFDAILVQFSSDYVFGREPHDTPIPETVAPSPLNVYGVSKAAGEYFAHAYWHRVYVIRTCGLYGEDGDNFVEAILRDPKAKVVRDQTCTPTSASDLAAVMPQLLRSAGYGTYHLTNSGATTWFDFAKAVYNIVGGGDIAPVYSHERPSKAKRPAYSVLANTAAGKAGIELRPWQVALEAYLGERDKV